MTEEQAKKTYDRAMKLEQEFGEYFTGNSKVPNPSRRPEQCLHAQRLSNITLFAYSDSLLHMHYLRGQPLQLVTSIIFDKQSHRADAFFSLSETHQLFLEICISLTLVSV